MTTGFDAIPLPKVYIKVIADMEEALASAGQDKKPNKKKASGAAAKGLNAMKAKIKKISKQYEKQLAEYKKVIYDLFLSWKPVSLTMDISRILRHS